MPFHIPPPARNRAIASLRRTLSQSPFVCPTCSFHRLIRSASSRSSHYTPRRALHISSTRSLAPSAETTNTTEIHESRLASRTAINPPTNIPPSNRALYSSLDRLKHVASDYVDQSRIQLALRGLESETPTIRVGLLGLGKDGDVAARKLAAVLLADPLGEEAAWETALKSGQSSGKALLIRYGAEDDIPPLNPLVDTVCVPSTLLQKHNLEILITSLRADAAVTVADPAGLVESMLVPPLQTPVASSGRAGFVRYPVHKAIVVGEGIEGCIDYGRLSTSLESTVLGQSGMKERLIQVALSVPRDTSSSVKSNADTDLVTAVDIDQAAAALQVFRQDIANGPLFNAKWQASNMETIKTSLISDTEALSTNSDNPLRPALEHHIRSTLASADAAITASELLTHSTAASKAIPDTTRAELQAAITSWSEAAHTDLQVSLATALASRSWRRTSWTRLLWRVDDVGLAAESLLRNHFLLSAEASLAFLAGRIQQAGFSTSSVPAQHTPASFFASADPTTIRDDPTSISSRSQRAPFFSTWFTTTVAAPTPDDLVNLSSTIDRVRQTAGIDLRLERPWPLDLHFTRQTLLHTLVPALQARAQSLLLRFLTTAGASSALGAWVWVATSGAGVYEGGAVAALGVVWAARRLQRGWEGARGEFEGSVREGGRVVLGDVERVVRECVGGGERVGVVRGSDVEGWAAAREAVGQVREVLGGRVGGR